jgi:hypothetical protein
MNPPTSPEKPSWVKRLTAWCEAHWVELLLGIIGVTVLALMCSESLFVLLAKIGNVCSFFSSKSFPFAITNSQFTPNDYLTHLGHFRQGLLTLGGGLVGVLVAWRGYMNLQLEKEKLQTEKDKEQTRIAEETKREQNQRFAQAVGLLGHEAVAVRTGAIYSLQQLMVEAPEAMGLKICRLLAGYVNEHGPKVKWETRYEEYGNESGSHELVIETTIPLPIDPKAEPADNAVMAALQVLAERDLPDAVEQEVDFNFAKLDWGRCDTRTHGFYATDVYASKAFFERTKDKPEERKKNKKLSYKAYVRAKLQQANLQVADLKWADLQRADLKWADLQEADLKWANLQGANLQVADLKWADLQEAFNGEDDNGEPLALTFEDLKTQNIIWDERTVFPDGTGRHPDGTRWYYNC